MSVYGNMFSSIFPELLVSVKYFEAGKNAVAGWQGRKYIKTIKAHIQDQMKSGIDVEGGIITTREKTVMYTAEPVKLGNYIEYNGLTYRIMKNTVWTNEAEFASYVIEQVNGNTDRQITDTKVKYGSEDYE